MFITTFGIIALAAKDIGKWFGTRGVPLITGFLLTGLAAGPHGLSILGSEAVNHLQFLDWIALGFIGFLAGGELHVEGVRSRLRSILLVLVSISAAVAGIGTAVLFLSVPVLQAFSDSNRLVAALLCASVLMTLSPAAVVAVLKELRARGPFSQTILGVTVLMDGFVIFVFAGLAMAADVLMHGGRLDLMLPALLAMELSLNVLLGIALGILLNGMLAARAPVNIKRCLLLAVGGVVFAVGEEASGKTLAFLPVKIFSEPLLICMTAGAFLSNFSRHRLEFAKLTADMSPLVFMVFFTMLGAELEINALRAGWLLLLLLLVARLAGIWAGAYAAAALAGEFERERNFFGLAFVTQAGVSLSLAKVLAFDFPGWGSEISAILVGVIVINTVIGPSFLKYALSRAGETHERKAVPAGESQAALIIGLDAQAIMLAKQLRRHGWTVRLADLRVDRVEQMKKEGWDARHLAEISEEGLRLIGADRVEAVVGMMDSETNYRICELAFEHFGTDPIVVRLQDEEEGGRFRDLGVLTIDNDTAAVSMLDHAVRAPSAISFLLGQGAGDLLDITVANRNLDGLYLRNIHLPADLIVVSVRRDKRTILTHGYTRIVLNDELTLVGSEDSLKEARLIFAG